MTGVSSAATSRAGSSTPRSGWIWPDDEPVSRSRLKSAKLWMLRRADRSGLSRALRESAWRCRRLLILAYHGISIADEHQWSPELYMPSAALRARFELLRDGGYNVIPLREGVARLRAGTLPPASVALTFDDGMVDFKTGAMPLLQEFQFPATVFVTTYYAEKQVPVFRIACRYLLWMGRDGTISGDGLTTDGQPLELHTEIQRYAALVAIEQRLTTIRGGVDEELATLRRVAERVGADFDRFIAGRQLQVMSPDEIRSLPRDLIEVQLHTHRHRVPLRESSFEREIVENRNALSAWRPGEVLDVFCYPSGVTHPSFLPWLRGMDIHVGLTCETGMATARTNPLLLPRLVDTTGMTRLEFESWLSGVGSFIPRLHRRELYGAAPVDD